MASKRYKSLPKDTKKIKAESINKLISVVKKNCTSKFEESIDINFQINVKQKKGEVNLRAMVNLPVGTGKKIKVAVVCEDTKLDEAKKTSADIVGSEDLIEKISLGKIDFDKLISTPAMMIKLSKLGKLLGPKGLMPNPKLGTVTANIPEAVKLIKSGQVEIKNDKDGNIGTNIGKKSFSDQNLINTSTMGVSYKLKLDKNI